MSNPNVSHSTKIFVFVVLLWSFTLPAAAEDADYDGLVCGVYLNAVGEAIHDTTFLGRNAATNESNLLAKLANAVTKVARTKYLDAIDKLGDISDAATAYANAPKPKLEDATAINNAVSNAIICLGKLPGS